MIGIVVTGHGNFAAGLTSSIRNMAGIPEKYISVDYPRDESPVELEQHLAEAFTELKECREILVFTDVQSGAPCTISAELAGKFAADTRIAVITGTNLGMLMQANLARAYISNVMDLAEMAVEEGQRQVHLCAPERLSDQ